MDFFEFYEHVKKSQTKFYEKTKKSSSDQFAIGTIPNSYDFFSETGMNVIRHAEEETVKMGHNFIGSEQLLIGIMNNTDSWGYHILLDHGIQPKKLREAIETKIQRGSGAKSKIIPFTPRGRRILAMAIKEAHDIGDLYAGSEHILLSIIKDEAGIAIEILNKLGLNRYKMQHDIVYRISKFKKKKY